MDRQTRQQGVLRRSVGRLVTLFADASALISILTAESDAIELAGCLEHDRDRLYSAISAWETVAGLCHADKFSVDQARDRLKLFVESLDFRLVAIGDKEYTLAMDAYTRFGKDRHPAKLNMGDCYAYACARANHATLPFKGDDFSKTEISPAIRPL
jgi:ribonuclease VapC